MLLSPEEFIEDILSHGDRPYDAAKRREYYLKNRKLKGRSSGTSELPTGQFTGASTSNDIRDSRRKELEAERDRLVKKLEDLRKVLRAAVAEAKGRSAPKNAPDKEDETKDTSNKTKKDSKDSKSEPLTEKQKAEKRKASKEQYEKEKRTSLSRDVEVLRQQVKEMRSRIEKALEADRNRKSDNQSETAQPGR